MKIAVIGAGPAGITAAYELVKAGYTVEVYEASPSVGGMAKTINLWGTKVDLGPHRFFSKDLRVNKLWLELIKTDYRIVKRKTSIYYNDKFYNYPLKAFNILGSLGFKEACVCFLSYLVQKIKPLPENGSFENWMVSRFGWRLYKIFFKPYSEKLWGIKCSELDSDFAAQRINKLSLFQAIKDVFWHKKNKNLKTLVDQFAYPKSGSGEVYQRMANFILNKGSKIFFDTKVENLIIENSKIIGLKIVSSDEVVKYDKIISTMPITHLLKTLPNSDAQEAAKNLKFRNTVLVYLKIDLVDIFDDQWIYIQDPNLKVGRITNFRNWVPELCEGTRFSVLALEYWFNDDELRQLNNSQEFIQAAIKELKLINFCEIKDSQILDAEIIKIPNCYPVYLKNYKEHLAIIENYLRVFENLSVIGRYGAFKYNNQDHSILMGILAAENIIKNTKHDLWSINSDYEIYQEQALINETGLVQI